MAASGALLGFFTHMNNMNGVIVKGWPAPKLFTRCSAALLRCECRMLTMFRSQISLSSTSIYTSRTTPVRYPQPLAEASCPYSR